jgi:predicted MPP superfamily phosphohydrolase
MKLSEHTSTEISARNVLEEGFLHHALLAFNLPANWPGWLVWLSGLGLAALPLLSWRLLVGDGQLSLLVGLTQWLFFAVDLIILLALPKGRFSFGPWKPQFFTLALPRVSASLLISIASLWIGSQLGFAFFLVLQLLGTFAFVWGALVEPFRLKLIEHRLATDRIPAGSPPIRILHISDLHVERLTRREAQVLRLVQQAKPDVIVITGDYVNLSYNRDPETHELVRHLLGQLSAPFGVYATLGSPSVDLRDTMEQIFKELPVTLMREDWEQVTLGKGRQIVLLGLDCTHHLPTDKERLHRLMSAAPNGVPQVLLYHSPELMPQATEHGIDLYLCGHTHGGQVRLPFIGALLTSSQLGRKYVMGHYRDGCTHLYVSRGVGLEGLSAPRVRFLSPPEITLFTIEGSE